MDFTYSEQEEAFRGEVRVWLAEHLTDRFRALGTAASSVRRQSNSSVSFPVGSTM